MVRLIERDGNNYYLCESCGHAYHDRETAEKCEEFCKKNNACSLEITRHGLKMDEF